MDRFQKYKKHYAFFILAVSETIPKIVIQFEKVRYLGGD